MKRINQKSFTCFASGAEAATFRWWPGGAELAVADGTAKAVVMPIDGACLAAFREAIDAFTPVQKGKRARLTTTLTIFDEPGWFGRLRYANRGDPWDEGIEIVLLETCDPDADDSVAAALSTSDFAELSRTLDAINDALSASPRFSATP